MMELSRRSWVLVVLAAAAPLSVLGDEPEPVAQTSYHEHVLPIFRARCVGCHGGEKPKGDLVLGNWELAMKGGEEGPPLVPGKPDESLLYLLITGAEKPVMPPRREGTLSPEEVAVIRAWIEGGCLPGVARTEPLPYSAPTEPPIYRRPPAVRALAWSREGEVLLVAGFREVLAHRAAKRGTGLPDARLAGEAEQINALAVSPDGALLAAVGGNPARFGELQLWDLAGRTLVRFVRIGKDTLYAVAFSPDGGRVAVAGTDRALHVLETATGEEVYASELHADWILGLAFDAEGKHIVTGSRDKTLKVSTASDGALLGNVVDLGGQILRVAGRPGTSHVLAAGETRTPVLFDLAERKELRKFESQPGAVLAAAFSADGGLLAVGGAAPEVRVYGVDDGRRKATLAVPTRWVYAIAVRPDGRQAAVSGYDGVVRVFDLESGAEEYAFVPVPVGRARRF